MIYVTGGGGSGGTLTVNGPAGVVVTATKDGKTKTRTANAQGVAVFKGLTSGVWSITITDPTGIQQPTTISVNIVTDYSTTIAFFAASITATWPVGSTCTCTKGDIVITAPDTSGSYTFTAPSTGDWIISCNNGLSGDAYEETSQTVSITADGQSESVILSYTYYLYNEGDQIEHITGGWTRYPIATSGTRVSFETDHIYSYTVGLASNASAIRQGSAAVSNKIDISGFTALHVLYDRSGPSSNVNFTIMVTENYNHKEYGTPAAKVTPVSYNVTDFETVLDVSDFDKAYYVRFYFQTNNATAQVVKIKKVWLE